MPYKINSEGKELLSKKEEGALTDNQAEVLRYLAKHPGDWLTSGELAEALGYKRGLYLRGGNRKSPPQRPGG